MNSKLKYNGTVRMDGVRYDKKLTQFINPAVMCIGGIIITCIGIYFHLLTQLPYTQGVSINFISIVNLFGVFLALQGIVVLLRGLIGNRLIVIHQMLMAIQVLISLASLYIGYLLYVNPEVIPILIYNSDVGLFVNLGFPFDISYLKILILFGIILGIIGALNDTYKIGKLDRYKA